MSFQLLSSPLQGFTDFRFRNAFHHYFGGIDTFYAPYIRFNGKPEIKKSYQKDLDPANNNVPNLVPQVMTNKVEEFMLVVNYVKSLGYKELNWNLGCPYPMVTKQGMGSGLICQPQLIDEILEATHSQSDIQISMKMRMGFENPTEILDVFPILEKYPLKSIAIHARIGKQLYKGPVNLDAFETCLQHSQQPIYYNGDITSVESFRKIQGRFPDIDHFLIGRGLIADPFLPSMIKNNTETYPSNRWELFQEFHNTIFEQYNEALSGPTPIKMKMLGFWEYFSTSFADPKTFKKIKKAGNLKNYQIAVEEIFKSAR